MQLSICGLSASRGVFCRENEEPVQAAPPPSVDGDYLLTFKIDILIFH